MKHRLDNEILLDSFYENCFLMGIVAPLKDYTFAWYINQKLGFHFRNNHLEIELVKKKRSFYFPVFEFENLQYGSSYFLYNNQHDGEYLLPEFKHLDYLWLVKAMDELPSQTECNTLLQTIRQIPAVQLANELLIGKIKNKSHLVF